MPDDTHAEFYAGFRFPKATRRRPHCWNCGRFISAEEAADTSGRVNDIDRGNCWCRKCQTAADQAGRFN